MERFIQDNIDLQYGYQFDIGKIIGISKDTLTEPEDSNSEATPETTPIFNGIYTVELQTSLGILPNVQAYGEGKNNYADVSTFGIGSLVLIGYIGNDKIPFILKSISASRKDQIKGTDNGQELPDMDQGEHYKSSVGGASEYLKSDGGAELKGKRSNGTYTSNSYIRTGGNLGVNNATGKNNSVTIGKNNIGDVVSVDEDGNIIRTTSNSDIKNVGNEEHNIASNSNTKVGEDYNLTTKNANIDSKAPTINPIDTSLPKNQIGKGIALGDKDKANENAILGQQFQKAFIDFLDTWINNSINIGTGNMGAPVPINPLILASLQKLKLNLPKMLSKKTFLEKDNEVI
jgi:hypothetical protein